MTYKGIIGRKYEQHLITERCQSGKAELIAVYGRRRVGKTFLVRKMFDDKFAFSFTGMYEVSRLGQLEHFRNTLQQYSGKSIPRLFIEINKFSRLFFLNSHRLQSCALKNAKREANLITRSASRHL